MSVLESASFAIAYLPDLTARMLRLVSSQSFPHLWKKLWKIAAFRVKRSSGEGRGAVAFGMNLWDEILARIETKVNRHSFYTWFKPTTFVAEDAATVTVRVPNALFKDWLTKHYSGVISEAMSEVQQADIWPSTSSRSRSTRRSPIPLGPDEAAALRNCAASRRRLRVPRA